MLPTPIISLEMEQMNAELKISHANFFRICRLTPPRGRLATAKAGAARIFSHGLFELISILPKACSLNSLTSYRVKDGFISLGLTAPAKASASRQWNNRRGNYLPSSRELA